LQWNKREKIIIKNPSFADKIMRGKCCLNKPDFAEIISPKCSLNEFVCPNNLIQRPLTYILHHKTLKTKQSSKLWWYTFCTRINMVSLFALQLLVNSVKGIRPAGHLQKVWTETLFSRGANFFYRCTSCMYACLDAFPCFDRDGRTIKAEIYRWAPERTPEFRWASCQFRS